MLMSPRRWDSTRPEDSARSFHGSLSCFSKVINTLALYSFQIQSLFRLAPHPPPPLPFPSDLSDEYAIKQISCRSRRGISPVIGQRIFIPVGIRRDKYKERCRAGRAERRHAKGIEITTPRFSSISSSIWTDERISPMNPNIIA